MFNSKSDEGGYSEMYKVYRVNNSSEFFFLLKKLSM